MNPNTQAHARHSTPAAATAGRDTPIEDTILSMVRIWAMADRTMPDATALLRRIADAMLERGRA